MDLLQREGKYPVPPQAPKTMGVEFSGTVVEFGPDCRTDLKVGEEVFGLAYGGEFTLSISDSGWNRWRAGEEQLVNWV